MNDSKIDPQRSLEFIEVAVSSSSKGMFLLWVLALFSSLSAISVDLFFPAVSIVKSDFGVTDELVQGSVYGFFIGLGIAQLIWGNLSDYIGRRPVMLVGSGFYCASVLACLLSSNIYWFIFFRFLQGMSAAVGIIMARAIIRDVYGPDKSAKALATMFLLFSTMPMLLPAVGGYVSTHLHWHGVLYLMLVVGVLVVVLSFFYLKETAPLAKSNVNSHQNNIVSDYRFVASNLVFVKNALTNMLAFSALLIFVSNSSVLLDKYYYLGPIGVGHFLMFFGFCLMTGVALLRFYLVSKIGVLTTIKYAGIGLLVGCLLLTSLVQLGAEKLYVAVFPVVLLVGGSIGILLTLSAGEAIKPFTKKAGTASSLYGFVQHTGASLIGFMLSILVRGNLYALPFVMFLLALLVVLTGILIRDEIT